jgi:hypothetical protein
MQKPSDCPLSTDATYDSDITERVVRQLQESHLHVHWTMVMSSLPDALLTGGPEDEHSGLMVDMTLQTDGRRGFLVLVDEVPEYDAPLELTELLASMVPSDAFVVRGANMSTFEPCERPRTVRLTDPARVRDDVERAYEEAFAGRGPIDHRAFLAAFAPYGYSVEDERALRSRILDLDRAFGRAPSA